MTIIDLIGKKFGMLTVVDRDFKAIGPIKWVCNCECGQTASVLSSLLRNGGTKSCGCFRRQFTSRQFTTHSQTKTSTHRTWCDMKTRCYNKRRPDYVNYGGRGITVCDRWLKSFSNFLADMGERPFPDAQLDRIDNNGCYSPDNCRWVTRKTNSRNKRNNKFYSLDGQLFTISQLSEQFGIRYLTLWKRIVKRRWTVERAVGVKELCVSNPGAIPALLNVGAGPLKNFIKSNGLEKYTGLRIERTVGVRL